MHGYSRWLIHPNTDPSASVPIVRRRENFLGFDHPYIVPQVPQLARERRNLSISSVSSQASSNSAASSETIQISPPFATYEQVIPTPALVDTESGAIFPPDSTSIPRRARRRDGSPRYQEFLLMTCPAACGPQSPRSMPPRPRYEHQTEKRTIHIRDLNHNVEESTLRSLLNAQGLGNHCGFEIRRSDNSNICHAFVTFSTAAEASDAVRRLHNHRFMERNLQLALAQDRVTVRIERPIIADGSVF